MLARIHAMVYHRTGVHRYIDGTCQTTDWIEVHRQQTNYIVVNFLFMARGTRRGDKGVGARRPDRRLGVTKRSGPPREKQEKEVEGHEAAGASRRSPPAEKGNLPQLIGINLSRRRRLAPVYLLYYTTPPPFLTPPHHLFILHCPVSSLL